ncbi:MAG TPA: hypothetical protein PKA27_02050 [Fimbriimonadaceae bacterium]|nr:hypothetical protein [Fimbriimonadaceae bacterium]
MYERRRTPPIPHPEFRARVIQHVCWTAAIVAASIAIGILGYHYIAGMPWIDSLLNASMILGGMGPVDVLPNDAAKVFASLYALFSGIVFIGVSGLLIAPFAHRLLHRFHWEDDSKE